MADLTPHADVLIVTVTDVEGKAVMEVFREGTGKDPRVEPIGDRIYHDLGEVNGARVFMALSEMGAGGIGASQLISQTRSAKPPEGRAVKRARTHIRSNFPLGGLC